GGVIIFLFHEFWPAANARLSRKVLLLHCAVCVVKFSFHFRCRTVVKKRLVKLVVNFLFYFRTDEEEPIGALLLEQCRVEREDSQTFSIAFLDEAERKYLFECDSEEQCGEWVDSIIKASYEFMRKNLIFYRTEIHRLTGKDPLEQYGISDETRFQVSNGLQLMSRDTSSL
uniref:Pleckstrin homology domain-containing family J member 1 n=1 Tax=Amphiprion percula TaxID=161767 RepID=A0A3P8SX87_AMPPE